MKDERIGIRLRDNVEGRSGIYLDVVPVESRELPPNIDDAYRVKFIPDRPAQNALIRWVYNHVPFIGEKKLSVTTDTMYPRDAIEGPKNTPTYAEGVPEQVVILHENIHGEAPMSEFEGRTASESIKKAQSKRERANKERAHEELQNIKKKSGNDSSNNSSKGRSPRNRSRV